MSVKTAQKNSALLNFTKTAIRAGTTPPGLPLPDARCFMQDGHGVHHVSLGHVVLRGVFLMGRFHPLCAIGRGFWRYVRRAAEAGRCRSATARLWGVTMYILV